MATTPFITDAEATQKIQQSYNQLETQLDSIAGGSQGAIAIADTPTEIGYYYPTESGTYTNAGGLVVDLTAGITILIYDGTNWAMQVVPIAANGVVEENNVSAVSGGEVYAHLQKNTLSPSDVGIIRIKKGTDILSEISQTDKDDTDIWGGGYLRDNGTTITPDSDGIIYSKEFIKAYHGDYDSLMYNTQNSYAWVYDKDYNYISSVRPQNGVLSLPEETAWIKITVDLRPIHGSRLLSDIYLYKKTQLDIVTDDVFLKKESLEVVTKELATKEEIGVRTIPEGTNIIEDFVKTDLDDPEVWGVGTYTVDGTTSWIGAKRLLKYVRAYPGEYKNNLYAYTNAYVHVYDENFEFIDSVQSVGGIITLPEGTEYIRFAHLLTDTLADRYLELKNDIDVLTSEVFPKTSELNIQTGNILKNIYKKQYPSVPYFPTVSFIVDDGGIGDYEWLKPMFDTKGIKCTLAVPNSSINKSGQLSTTQLREFISEGYEIASHTYNNENLSNITLEEVDDSLRNNKAWLLSLGSNGDMFVPPQGAAPIEARKLIRKYHKASFVTRSNSLVATGDCCNIPPINSYFLNRIAFDGDVVTQLQVCKDAVDVAVANGGWLILTIHTGYAEYADQQKRDELSQLIDYIQSFNVPILTAGRAFEIHKNHVEIGNRGLDDRYYVLGRDLSEEGNYFD